MKGFRMFNRFNRSLKAAVLALAALLIAWAASPAVAQAPTALTDIEAALVKAGIEAFLKSTAPDLAVQGPVAAVVDGGTVRLAFRGVRIQRDGVRIALRDLRVAVAPSAGGQFRFTWQHAPEVRITADSGADLGVVRAAAEKGEGVFDLALGTIVNLDARYRDLKFESPTATASAKSATLAGSLAEPQAGQANFALDWRIDGLVSETPEAKIDVASLVGRETGSGFSLADYIQANKALGYGDLPGFRLFAGLSAGTVRPFDQRSPEIRARLAKTLAEHVARSPEVIDRAFGVPLATNVEVGTLTLVDRAGNRGGFTRLTALGRSGGIRNGIGSLALTMGVEGIQVPAFVADPTFVPREARLAVEVNQIPVRQALVNTAQNFGTVRSLALSDDGAFRVRTPEIAAWLLDEARGIVAGVGTELALTELAVANPTYKIGAKGTARATPKARYLFAGNVTIEAEGLDPLQGAIERHPQASAFADLFSAVRAAGARDGPAGRGRHVYRLAVADDGRFTINGKDMAEIALEGYSSRPGPLPSQKSSGGAVRRETLPPPTAPAGGSSGTRAGGAARIKP